MVANLLQKHVFDSGQKHRQFTSFENVKNTKLKTFFIRLKLVVLFTGDRLRVYCDVVRTTSCGQLCKGKGVRKALRERCCEKIIVRKTLWERRCEKDVVRKALWERRCKNIVMRKIILLTCLFLLTNIRVKECFA